MKKKFTAMSLVMAIVMSVFAFQFGGVEAEAAGKTGVGLAEHALNCYYGGWQYEYGYAGQVVNGVHLSDCSGMIYAYTGTARSSGSQIASASASGSVSSIPRIHGLGLWMQGHVGVYVGGGMAVDCRSDAYNIVYEGVTQHRWVKWYKVPGVSYPTTGWVTFQGEKYYYENGQYVVNTIPLAGMAKLLLPMVHLLQAGGKIPLLVPAMPVIPGPVQPETTAEQVPRNRYLLR